MMRPCRDIARLVSESLDHKLTFRERLAVVLHTMICGTCRVYKRQIQALSALLRHHVREQPNLSFGPELSPEARERILITLKGDESP